jgi:Putative lumazine-binding
MQRKSDMSTTITPADEAESYAAYDAINATLQNYIEGARTGSSQLMRSAFMDTARVQGSYGGEPADITLDAFCARIDKGGPAADLEARVVAIDLQGTAAVARLEANNWRGFRYTDFFVLLKRSEGWKIASKVFFAHSHA